MLPAPSLPPIRRHAHVVLEAPGVVRVLLTPGGSLFIQRPGRPDIEVRPEDTLVSDNPDDNACPSAGELVEAWASAPDRLAIEMLAAMRYLHSWSKWAAL